MQWLLPDRSFDHQDLDVPVAAYDVDAHIVLVAD
jgi:hypothetical protein